MTLELVGMSEQSGELGLRRVIALGDLRQSRGTSLVVLLQVGLGLEQPRRERDNRAARILAGPHHCNAPEIDRRYDARRSEARHEASKSKRGLARSARADDEQKRRAPFAGVFQRIDRLGDVA